MEITEVRITLTNEEKLKAFANITFDNSFVVRGFKVISGSQGYFVSMPSRKRKDGTFQDSPSGHQRTAEKNRGHGPTAFEAEANKQVTAPVGAVAANGHAAEET